MSISEIVRNLEKAKTDLEKAQEAMKEMNAKVGKAPADLIMVSFKTEDTIRNVSTLIESVENITI